MEREFKKMNSKKKKGKYCECWKKNAWPHVQDTELKEDTGDRNDF